MTVSIITGIIVTITGVFCNHYIPNEEQSNLSNDTMLDVEGNVYTTVKIGDQEWMAENLRTTKFNDGTEIPLVTSEEKWSETNSPGYCYYNNTTNVDSINKFGALYNWYTIATGKIAPEGWHVPSNKDWDILVEYLITHGYNYDGTRTGDKSAKSLSTKTDWHASMTAGAIGNEIATNNSSGFAALPGGCRLDAPYGSFSSMGTWGYWWRYDENDSSSISNTALNYDDKNVWMSGRNKKFGSSLRLLRNN